MVSWIFSRNLMLSYVRNGRFKLTGQLPGEYDGMEAHLSQVFARILFQ